jgi:hypothetical protein
MKPQFPLAILAAVLMMAAKPHPATASLITYDLSSNASATFTPDVIDLAGSFTFDTTTNAASSASITATCTGPVCPFPQSFTTTDYTEIFTSDQSITDFTSTTSTDHLVISFATPLTGSDSSLISDVTVHFINADLVAGSVSPVPVPAPNAGAGVPGLLACGLAFLFWRGRSAAMALVRRRQRLFEPVAS